ncbi:hypothetical protein D5086_032226 [Populus alba]|uniref:Uncharacterized protein n=1 Tax=Populus alba TaxID=43335 RepID=A0ACC4ALI8_POPAL
MLVIYLAFNSILGLGGSFRSYNAVASTEQTVLKLDEVDGLVLDGEVAKIRGEFEAAKQGFLRIPEAVKGMPKMNPEGIYVNKNLRLDNIQVYGFDYDYTLAHYSPNLQQLIYDLAKEHMVNEFRYPETCLKFRYDQTFPIRGLSYDKKNGCLLKLDFFGSIEPDGCYFGRRKLNRKEIEQIYGTRHIGRDQARGLVGLMDFFCFSEACLLADVVQHFVDAKLEFDATYIYQDVDRAIQHVHRSGLVHRGILSDPYRYLVKNGRVLRFLTMLREKGKKLFLLTNSPYNFVDGGMRFMLEDSLGYRDSWRELFDVVIAKANKPEFYTSEHPFRYYDMEKDTLAFNKVDAFLPNKIYYHGSLKSFLQITKWNGPEVIYFGDHLFSDLRGPSKAGWRTAAIIHELENEIRIQNDDNYRFEQAKFHIIQELLGKLHATVANSQRSEVCQLLSEELNDERLKARSKMKKMFNKSFGATFLTDKGQESAFAYYIHQYADVYTSKPENFLLYSPEAWLHVPFDIKIMPHHVKLVVEIVVFFCYSFRTNYIPSGTCALNFNLVTLFGTNYSCAELAYSFMQGETEMEKKIRDLAREEERLSVFEVDVLDYHSILIALKGCSAMFCCLDCPDGYDDKMIDLEVRGAINVVEACAQTDTIEKIIFSSSLTAAIWRENICSQEDVDERSWSDQEFCRKLKLWYALAKTLSEHAAWALAMDRKLNMVSINAGLVLGPGVSQQNPLSTMSYLKGIAQMYENGVLAYVDVNFLVDVHIRAFQDSSTCGRYFCFNQTVHTEEEAVKLTQSLSPLISLPQRYEYQGSEVFAERLRTKKLNKLVEGTA